MSHFYSDPFFESDSGWLLLHVKEYYNPVLAMKKLDHAKVMLSLNCRASVPARSLPMDESGSSSPCLISFHNIDFRPVDKGNETTPSHAGYTIYVLENERRVTTSQLC